MRKNRPDTQPLRLVPMLRDANRRSLEALAPHTDVVTVPAGRTVAESGRTARELLVLVEGEAQKTGPDGLPHGLAAGAEIGADELRAHGQYEHTVVTRTDATFVVIEGRAFRGIDRRAS